MNNSELNIEQVKTIISRSFDCGQNLPAQCKQQVIDDIVQEYNIKCEELRIWKIEELLKMPIGSIFHHVKEGRGWVIENAKGTKLMQFRNGTTGHFNSNNDPWNQPMKLISTG